MLHLLRASAARRPSNEQIKQDMISMFLENKNILTDYNLNGNTTVGTLVDTSKLEENAKHYKLNSGNAYTINNALGDNAYKLKKYAGILELL